MDEFGGRMAWKDGTDGTNASVSGRHQTGTDLEFFVPARCVVEWWDDGEEGS
jgi:hypothetical protein